MLWHTLKKDIVAPLPRLPYLICVCLAKSSTLVIGVTIRCTVRNADIFAMYNDRRTSVNIHQKAATTRVLAARGVTSTQ